MTDITRLTQAATRTTLTDVSQRQSNYKNDFVEGALYGDLLGEKRTPAQVAGQTAVGFVPIAGQMADLRDAGYAFYGIGTGREGAWRDLGLSLLGLIPGIGDVGKGASRVSEVFSGFTTQVSLNARKVYSLGESLAKDAHAKLVRLRHFTNSRGLRGIQEEQLIRAEDQGRVFTDVAKGKPPGPRVVEDTFGLSRGRGNNYVEFDASKIEYETVRNSTTGATERTFAGDVDLNGRNPEFKKNR